MTKITIGKGATKEERAAAIAKAAAEKAAKERIAVPAVAAKDKREKDDAALKARIAKVEPVTNEAGVRDEVAEAREKKASAKPAKAKVEKDPNTMSVSDVAREAKVDPKQARARLRKARGGNAKDGRWETVTRGSKEHAALLAIIAPDVAKVEDASEEDEGESSDE